MGIQAENNQYYRGKAPIITEYSEAHRTILSATAARNFTHPPGFLFEASLALEEVGKNKLSILNYSIVSEAITRELTQTGHDYTQAYKTSRIAFELNKQTLLTALQNEFADLDRTQSLKKEELDRLFVELDVRRIILITTKTAIELQLEALKQELVDIDKLTFTNEEALINEKVTTATAKLAVIPHLEELIVAQGKILSAEEANVPCLNELIDKKGLLISKKTELLPYLVDRAAKQEVLAGALSQQIAFKQQMIAVAIDKILLQSDIVDNRIAILDAEILVEDMRQLLNAGKYDLRKDKMNNEIKLLSTDAENLGKTDAQRATTLIALQGDKGQLRTDREESEDKIVGDDIIRAESIKDSRTSEEKSLIVREKTTQVADITNSADAAAAAKITSKLIHIIGS